MSRARKVSAQVANVPPVHPTWTAPTASPNTAPLQSIRDIQADEIAFAAACDAKPQKSVHLVELEEEAIQELEHYYSTIYEEGTAFFVVRRESPARPSEHRNIDGNHSRTPTKWNGRNGIL